MFFGALWLFKATENSFKMHFANAYIHVQNIHVENILQKLPAFILKNKKCGFVCHVCFAVYYITKEMTH